MPAAASTSANSPVLSKIFRLEKKNKSGHLKRARRSSPLLASRSAPLLPAGSRRLFPENGSAFVFLFFVLPLSVPRNRAHCHHHRDDYFAGKPKSSSRRIRTELSSDHSNTSRTLRPCHRTARPKPLPSLESRAGEGHTSSPQHHHDSTAKVAITGVSSLRSRSMPVPCLRRRSAPQSS
jgi:hypothetical protein